MKHVILFKLKQSGTDDPTKGELLNTISDFIDSVARNGIGSYNVILSNDVLGNGTTKGRGVVLGTASAVKLEVAGVDDQPNLVLVTAFDSNGDPVDLGGEALIGIESPNSAL